MPPRRRPPRPAGVTALAGALLSAVLILPAPATRAAGAPVPPPPRAHADAAEGTSPLDLVSATFGQAGPVVHLELATAQPFAAAALTPGSGRSLCVVLRPDPGAAPDERVCAVGDPAARSGLRLRLTRLDAQGAITAIRTLTTPVARPSARRVVADIPPASLGLTPGLHAWQARSTWQDDAGCAPAGPGVSPCPDALPDRGPVPFRIAPLAPVGCAFRGVGQFRRGTGNRVALTFDDGPAAITPAFLAVLERERVPATFFVVGENVRGREPLLRRMLADGDMIANHSLTHARLGGAGPGAVDELARTQRIIRRATGFTPCLFRPPYGATSPALVAAAGAQGLTTVLWDVDPADYRRPGADAIRRSILAQGRAGSIVLSHDGGGPRAQTLAALPGVIRGFRSRGYRFVTVNDMLGLDVIRR